MQVVYVLPIISLQLRMERRLQDRPSAGNIAAPPEDEDSRNHENEDAIEILAGIGTLSSLQKGKAASFTSAKPVDFRRRGFSPADTAKSCEYRHPRDTEGCH
uniref:Uncharacterized protein n=1 Tax=Vitrella brassicaformis TaxID=1169539 RepID=A0A7S1JZ82_9ALVE